MLQLLVICDYKCRSYFIFSLELIIALLMIAVMTQYVVTDAGRQSEHDGKDKMQLTPFPILF